MQSSKGNGVLSFLADWEMYLQIKSLSDQKGLPRGKTRIGFTAKDQLI